jgi:hypothetical protein
LKTNFKSVISLQQFVARNKIGDFRPNALDEPKAVELGASP